MSKLKLKASQDIDYGGVNHHTLYAIRKNTKDPGTQAAVAPYEHRAFAREYVEDSPVVGAASTAVSIPVYTAAKALGLTDSRSPASFAEVKQAYKGIGEGWKNRRKESENHR